MIVAVDVNSDGRREVLGMDIGPSEAETFWTTFLRKLARCGLRGVKLVISDAHEGIKATVAKVLNTFQTHLGEQNGGKSDRHRRRHRDEPRDPHGLRTPYRFREVVRTSIRGFSTSLMGYRLTSSHVFFSQIAPKNIEAFWTVVPLDDHPAKSFIKAYQGVGGIQIHFGKAEAASLCLDSPNKCDAKSFASATRFYK